MKTMEERIEEIKHQGECGIYGMKNHMLPWYPDDGSFDTVINEMHIAQTKDMLSKAYYKYINICIAHGYSDGHIIGGIMQNEEQNKKFEVDIESVIKSLIEIKYTTVKLEEPVAEKEKSVEVKAEKTETSKNEKEESKPEKQETNSAGGVKSTVKLTNKIAGKVDYVKNLISKLESNQSEGSNSVDNIKSVCEEVKQMILSIDPTSCTEENISAFNDATAIVDDVLKRAEALEAKNTSATEKSAPDVVVKQAETSVEQTVAAHTENGFNIANFIKQGKQPVMGPNMPKPKAAQKSATTAFPHQICGLTDDRIVEEVGKHFKVLETLPAYALYDLLNNKLLTRRMKELDAKQRPNNPYLTQVNINEYIDVPELLQRYSLCFTMPCNDKSQVIMVLFNPVPVPDKNGVLSYPLHIFKAAKTSNK